MSFLNKSTLETKLAVNDLIEKGIVYIGKNRVLHLTKFGKIIVKNEENRGEL